MSHVSSASTIKRIQIVSLLVAAACCGWRSLLLLSIPTAFSFSVQLPSSRRTLLSHTTGLDSAGFGPSLSITRQRQPWTCSIRGKNNHNKELSASTSNASEGAARTVEQREQQQQQIQALFDKYATNGLLDKPTLETMPPFAELLSGGDLLQEEWNDIWDAAPKQDEGNDPTLPKVNVKAFAQIYHDVDDLFEDVEIETDEFDSDVPTTGNVSDQVQQLQQLDDELSAIYQSISNDQGLIGKQSLKKWEEVQKLLTEGLLGEDEFEELWEEAIKSPGTQNEQIGLSGFLNFNVALDELFDFEDEEDDVDNGSTTQQPRSMVVEGDLPPAVLFAQLADSNYLVGMDELKLWVELQEMLEEGDLLPSELQQIYDRHVSDDSSGKLTEEAFQKLYNDIDALFEDDGEENSSTTERQTAVPPRAQDTAKRDLLTFLELIEEGDEGMLPCGLDATEADQKQVLNIVNVLQQQPSNMIQQKQGNVELEDVAGTWELIYSSSSAMKFNKGLSGLGGSFPNGKFASVKQELKVTKFLNDMEYKERIEVNPSSASFDVSVTGSWDLRTSVSLFTGQPSIILNVEPERVNYGPTSTRADHWKSLGPMNMLDLSYLDDDLRIMRGCTSSDTLFIFKKVT
ncbi:plastid lipid-associated PAP/fibrillin family protein [Nitzschia inconspicua]|uniref:Plastid lipid-associated PAP/fibrillin family protein n=1 Tax=Nitzschia inconspicua TaxID=303405 RepID=A0A9K3PWU3_9STRA|nr:plastid lipid-associated PAP/fibrillin family protein [Nitzschia inconspicua]